MGLVTPDRFASDCITSSGLFFLAWQLEKQNP